MAASETKKTHEIYIQDPCQRTYLKFPLLQDSPDEEIIITDRLPRSIPAKLLTLRDLQTKLHELETPVLSRRSVSKSDDSTAATPPETDTESTTPQATRSPFSKISLLLELYLHLCRVAEALIENKAIREPIQKLIWLKICIKTLTDFSLDSEPENKAIDKAVLALSQEIEKDFIHKMKVEKRPFPAKELKRRLEEKTVQQIRSLYFIHHELSILTSILAPKFRQSSHSKKTMPPALMLITQTFFQERLLGHGKKDRHQITKHRIRCPSITAHTDSAGIHHSVAENLRMAVTEAKRGGRGGLTSYQLLTSLPQYVDFQHQAKTAGDLFLAAHTLNAESPDTPTVFIFNIPVNQHSNILSYHHEGYPEISEALVMADMAFIEKMVSWRTLEDDWKHYTKTNRLRWLQELRSRYATFLRERKPGTYFHTEPELFTSLELVKEALLAEAGLGEGQWASTQDMMQKALIKLYCKKYSGHNNAETADQNIYGLTVQALFSALDQDNLIGCKSANERFYLTEGLTQTLEAFLYSTLPPKIQTEMEQHFKRFLLNEINEAEFIEYPMRIHNLYRSYGSAIGPSLLDTGTPKCEVDSSSRDHLTIPSTNTNVFAPGVYVFIHQHRASKLQAHGEKLPHRLTHDFAEKEDLSNELLLAGAKQLLCADEKLYDSTLDPKSDDYWSLYGSTVQTRVQTDSEETGHRSSLDDESKTP